jgi:choline dehydrogenase-like flavoprotein
MISLDTVLVIERGDFANGPKAFIPYWGRFLDTDVMLNPTSAPNPGLNNATSRVPVAAVVGGGSIVNGMAFMRGSRADYDAWEELGNPGWGWKGLVPYFRKSTTFQLPSPEAAKQWNITWDTRWYDQGPVQITVPDFQYADLGTMREIWKQEGAIPRVDLGAGEGPGLYWAPESIDKKNGTRSSSRTAYYDPVRRRSNLHLLTGHTVDQILFQRLRATGVKIISRKDNRVSEVFARKEVILAAGAIQTPQLLQISGIGPKDVLNAAGIKVKKDLAAVGANFQDHATVLTLFSLSRQTFPNWDTITTNETFNATAWAEWEAHRTGPVAAGSGSSAISYSLSDLTSSAGSIARSLLSQKAQDYLPPVYSTSRPLVRGFEAQRAILAKHYTSKSASVASGGILGTGFAFTPFLKPTSRGFITLDPSNPHGFPIVHYNTLSNPVDASILLALLRRTRRFWSSPLVTAAFGNITEVQPGSQYQTDEELLGALRAGGLMPGLAHPSCTCAMIPEELGGCVGSDLKVHGIEGLSVVDASIQPLVPGAPLQPTVYAVAEKAADLIKGRA